MEESILFFSPQKIFSRIGVKSFRPPGGLLGSPATAPGSVFNSWTRQGSRDRLGLLLRLRLRGRLAFFGSRWLVFLLSRRLRFFRRCGFCFFLLLGRFCLGLLFCGRFRCLSCWGSRLLLFALLLCDSLVFRKHPVLQVRGNNIRGLSIRVDFDHAGGAGSSGPCCDAPDKHPVDWCLEVFRGELPHRQPIRRSCSFVVNN